MIRTASIGDVSVTHGGVKLSHRACQCAFGQVEREGVIGRVDDLVGERRGKVFKNKSVITR